MEVVNTVWRGSMGKKMKLKKWLVKLESKQLGNGLRIIHVNHQIKQPEQLIVRFSNSITMLLFKTGKFRLMGKGAENEWDASHCVYLVSGTWPFLELQTMTAVFKTPNRINLEKFTSLFDSYYNAEDFPAVQIRQFKPIHVNVFASGKIILCGIKDLKVANKIRQTIEPIALECIPHQCCNA
jgi:TATA-box binding protein (TBP) (component of TFIID and TFIIIB)